MTGDKISTGALFDSISAKITNVTPTEDINWNVVQIIVEKFTERYPEEVIGAAEYVKQLRAASKDRKFNELSEDSGRRHVMELPHRLDYALTLKYPQIFTGKNLHKFFKLYPIFFIPEKL